VIACEHREGLYPTNEQIIARLKEGLVLDGKNKLRINAKYEEIHNQNVYTKNYDRNKQNHATN
jgi:hypothetical protein